jgi:hypothetical protein
VGKIMHDAAASGGGTRHFPIKCDNEYQIWDPYENAYAAAVHSAFRYVTITQDLYRAPYLSDYFII